MTVSRQGLIGLADISPMLLQERKSVPATAGWLWELKFDGYRILAGTGPSQLKSRNGADATRWFPEITAALKVLPNQCVLDGEVCVLDDLGRSDFDRLHARARRRGWYSGADAVVYCVFDLLVLDGRDIRADPIEDRKSALERLMPEPPPGVLVVQGVLDEGQWLYEQALALELEGIVGKRVGSKYHAGVRSSEWIKVKRPGAIPPGRFQRKAK